MASETEICNMALSHLGVGKEISNLETDKSQEAQACRRFYDNARDATLRDFNWPFARRFVVLGLIETQPTIEWGFSYRYPSNCLMARRIVSGIRNETPESRVPYTLGADDNGELIYTDRTSAQLEYTATSEDPLRYPPDFVLAFSLRLAGYIAPRVTSGDAYKVGDRALKLYQYEIASAQASALNEQQGDQAVDASFVRARN